jgi:hypothetical protein
MKNLIKKILKEQTQREGSLSKAEVTFLRLLHKSGFDNRSAIQDIIPYLGKMGITGIEAFRIFELFKNNYNKYGDYSSEVEPKRIDIKNKVYDTPNRIARDLVMGKIPFKGSNVSANYVGDVYVVYSYGWFPIFVWVDDQWYGSSITYSSSTGKQMGQLRPHNQGKIIKASQEVLRSFIHDGYRE